MYKFAVHWLVCFLAHIPIMGYDDHSHKIFVKGEGIPVILKCFEKGYLFLFRLLFLF